MSTTEDRSKLSPLHRTLCTGVWNQETPSARALMPQQGLGKSHLKIPKFRHQAVHTRPVRKLVGWETLARVQTHRGAGL